MPSNWRELYETLFPIEQERDACEDIEAWIEAAHRRGTSFPWGELLIIGEHENRAGSMVFLSLHHESRWIFGNYLGLAPVYRSAANLRGLFAFLARSCISLVPATRGVLFEVERYSEDAVADALAACTAPERLSSPELREHEATLDAIRRIHFYQRLRVITGLSNARMIAFDRGEPIPYFQPAIQLPLDASNEVPLWLMLLPLQPDHTVPDPLGVDIQSVIDFLYLGLFASGYGSQSDTPLPGFDEYIVGARQRLLKRVGDQVVVATESQALSRNARRLILEWRRLQRY